MSKRNITYIKPEEPNFLKRLKEQVGYKEGPTVETKREELPEDFEDEDFDEEKPTVVVLNPGDLTAEEADHIQREKDKEEAEKPADLTLPVVFKKPLKRDLSSVEEKSTEVKKLKTTSKDKKSKASKVVLSFDADAEEDE